MEGYGFVLGALATILIVLPQAVPCLGFAYRPFHADTFKEDCVAQKPRWAVGLIHFVGFLILWLGVLIGALKSDRELVDNNNVVGSMMTIALLFYLGGNFYIDFFVVRPALQTGGYLEDQSGKLLAAQARYAIQHRARNGVIFVAIAIFFMAGYNIAPHTHDYPGVVGIGWILYGLGWHTLMMYRLRIFPDHVHHESSIPHCSYIFGLLMIGTGLVIVTWAMGTHD